MTKSACAFNIFSSKIMCIISVIVTVVVFGTSTNIIIASSRNSMVHDVGFFGALIVFAIYHLIYACMMLIGIMIFFISIENTKSNSIFYICIVSSAIVTVFTDILIGSLDMEISLVAMAFCLPMGAWIICRILYFLVKNRHKGSG